MLLLPAVEGGAQTDSLYLDAATLTEARKTAVAIPSASGITMDLSGMRTLPQLLGSSDPLNFAHYLPSMSAQTELEAGLHVQGNDHSHNVVSSGGVPIYGVSHLLGIFSVFNPSHFSKMDYKTSARGIGRLGGSIDMPLPDTLVRRVGLDASAGLIAGQGTLSLPLGSRAFVKASARRSYMNLLYGRYMSMSSGSGLDGTAIRYGFTDLNLTGLWTPSAKDKVWLDAYWGRDDVSGGYGLFDVDASTFWHNGMVALHWKHLDLEQSLYYTGFGLTLDAYWTGMTAVLESYLRTFGYNGSWRSGGFSLSLRSAIHEALPQNPTISGEYFDGDLTQAVERAWENTLEGGYSLDFGAFNLAAFLQGSAYLSPVGEWMWGLDPTVQLKWNLYRGGLFTLRYGFSRQYLFQTGMTDVGLPCEFWFLAGAAVSGSGGSASGVICGPQTSRGGSLSYLVDFGGGAYTFSAEAYYRRLFGQIEYSGSLLDFAAGNYSLEGALLHGDGRAFGLNLSLNKVSGALTGWISYAWGRSLRTFEGMAECPASHERIHELDAVLSWNVGRWSFGGTLVAASGTPYTAPEYLYLMGQRVVAWYGPHNGARLKPYFRGDVSVNYFFHRASDSRGGLENGINFSIYNVTCHQNYLYTRLWVNQEEETFLYGGVKLNIVFMPSISYFHKF